MDDVQLVEICKAAQHVFQDLFYYSTGQTPLDQRKEIVIKVSVNEGCTFFDGVL